MPCYHPLTGYYSKTVNEKTQKRNIVFNPYQANDDQKLNLPCGNCIGCRLEKSRQWAVRCVHEASLYENNCFITLTYDKNHLPRTTYQHYWQDDLIYNSDRPTLLLKHWQSFMKRLRKLQDSTKLVEDYDETFIFDRDHSKNIRFFHCGEYGEKEDRPHYHALLFNLDFPDKVLWTIRNGNKLYTSETLTKLWPYGFSSIGDLTFESAAYVARYVLKKQNGPTAALHYDGRKPEYTTMSRNPGIASAWFKKYNKDVYTKGYVVINGMKITPPKYYENALQKFNPEHYDEIKEEKSKNTIAKEKENTYDRLKARETVQNAKLITLKREI